MSDVVTTIAIAAGTAIGVAVATNWTVGPRLEARNRKIQAAHMGREQLASQLRAITAACERLQGIQIPAGVPAEIQTAIRGERARWRAQVDTATADLVDNLEIFALTFHGELGIRDTGVRAVGMMRMVWLSGRSDDRKVEIIREIAINLHAFYFGGFRSMLHPRRAITAREDLKARLDALEAGQ